MNTFKQSAIEVLKNKDTSSLQQNYNACFGVRNFGNRRSNTEATMNAQIVMDIKNKAGGSDFIRIAPGTFALNPNKKEIEQTPKIIEAEKEEEEKIVIEAGFIGKGGEHLVCSELLFRGFNASIMSVDIGVDISAIKDNKFFGIQVKTARKNNSEIYNFHIRHKSFERFNQGNIFIFWF